MIDPATTYLTERPDGLAEYRRVPHRLGAGFVAVEGRLLRRDGTPHDGRWYPCDGDELLALDRTTDVYRLLLAQAD